MSFNNDDFNQSSTGGRNEGFRDTRGGVDSGSYGHGQGTGAYDSSTRGIGSYAGQGQQRASDDQTFRTSDDLDSSPQHGQSQTQSSGQRAFGSERDVEKPGFGGSDSTYNTTSTGGAFTQRSDADPKQHTTSGSIPGTRSSDAASGGQYDNTTDDVRGRDQFGGQTGSRSDQFGGESERERAGGRATFGDKMRGNAEKLAGSMTGKQDLKERGQERKTGEF